MHGLYIRHILYFIIRESSRCCLAGREQVIPEEEPYARTAMGMEALFY